MTNRKSRRILNSSAYMGAGNKSTVFNQNARKPFQELADIYKKEAKKQTKSTESRKAFKALSEAEKQKIKAKIRQQAELEGKQKAIALMFSFLLGIAILAVIGYALRYFFFA